MTPLLNNKTAQKIKLNLKFEAESKDSLFHCEQNLPSQYLCKSCDFKTHFYMVLKLHFKNCHSKTKHLPKIGSIQTYSCKLCPFNTHFILFWLKHITTCEKKKPPPIVKKKTRKQLYKCQLCNYTTIYKNSIKVHNLHRHLSDEEINWFECDKCDYRAKSKTHMKSHTKRLHMKPRFYQCLQCPFQTEFTRYLKQHQLYKHTESDEVFECEHCTYKGKSKPALKIHYAKQHRSRDEDEWFNCENCSYKTQTKGNFERHQRAKHLHEDYNIIWNKCEECDYKTQTVRNLRRHVRNHMSDVWYQCGFCSYRSKRMDNLDGHRRSKHPQFG